MSDKNKDNIQALPQYSIDSLSTLGGFMSTMFTLNGIKQEHCIPARVVSYNRKSHLATIQPLLKYTIDTPEGKEYTDRVQYKNISVVRLGSNGFLIDFPLVAGDTGFLVAVDRSWKTAMKKNSNINPDDNEGPQPADDDSLVSFENGIFIPSSYVDIANESFDGLALRRIGDDGEDVGGIFLDEAGNTTVKNSLTVKNGGNSVIIDPEHLIKSDARFRVVSIPSGETFVDANGVTHIRTIKRSVLVDSSNESGDDILVNSRKGGIDDVSIHATSNIDDIPLTAKKYKSGNSLSFDIVLGEKEDDPVPSDVGGKDYCNIISYEEDEEAGGTIDNDVSNEPVLPSDGGIGGSGVSLEPISNAISYYPCVS